MLSVKNELLQALAASLDKLSPGAGSKAIFGSLKVAAHGDFATTAAMQLAKPLKLNPRQLAENLRTEMLAQPAFVTWVDAVEIAGPGFINIRLKCWARGPSLVISPSMAKVCWLSLFQPTRPARCT